MNVDESGSVANAFVQNMAFFLSGKVKVTIREAGQSLKSTTYDKSHNMTSIGIGFIIFAHGCVEMKLCGQNTSQKLVLSS